MRLASTAGLAGVVGLPGSLGPGSGAGGTPLEDHPAAGQVDGQSYLGEQPRDAEKLVVAFEDPSCPTCKRFHATGFQDPEAEVVEPDSASFVYRPYRYTGRAWATPAIHAILETAERDGDEAGVTSTPTFYLFADGSFTTEITNAQDVTAFEAGFEL